MKLTKGLGTRMPKPNIKTSQNPSSTGGSPSSIPTKQDQGVIDPNPKIGAKKSEPGLGKNPSRMKLWPWPGKLKA